MLAGPNLDLLVSVIRSFTLSIDFECSDLSLHSDIRIDRNFFNQKRPRGVGTQNREIYRSHFVRSAGTPSQTPLLCPAGFRCAGGEAAAVPCAAGTFCFSGTQENGEEMPCEAIPGYYCPACKFPDALDFECPHLRANAPSSEEHLVRTNCLSGQTLISLDYNAEIHFLNVGGSS